jgi:hypothetical protein
MIRIHIYPEMAMVVQDFKDLLDIRSDMKGIV